MSFRENIPLIVLRKLVLGLATTRLVWYPGLLFPWEIRLSYVLTCDDLAVDYFLNTHSVTTYH